MNRILHFLALAIALPAITLPAVALAAEPERRSAPTFEVQAVDGTKYSNETLKGTIVVLEWFNPGCPFVKRVYETGYMGTLQREAKEKGVVWLTVNSTNGEHGDFVPPGQVPTVMKEWKLAPTGYVVDQEGTVGKAFDAKTTPTIVVIDKNGRIAFNGAVDNYPQVSGDMDKLELYAKDAITAVNAGKPVARPFVKSYGCSIKYAS